MKKRVVYGVVVALLAVVLLSSVFVGCNGDSDEVPDFENFSSEKVDGEAAWKAAFDFSDTTNATLVAKADDKNVDNNTFRGLLYSEYKLDGNKLYFKQTWQTPEEGKNTEEVYYEFGDENFEYTYNHDTSKWKKDKSEDLPFTSSSDALFMNMEVYFSLLRDKYDVFTYDEEKKEYLFNGKFNEFHQSESYIAIKISNGKFFGMYLEQDVPSGYIGKQCATILLYSLGTTKVTLPTDVEVVE